jgi:methyl-galactoside transport system ATP-binding protein
MDEILRISDEVTILRDGKYISTDPVKDLTIDTIIKKMVGRDLTHRFPEKNNVPGDTLLQVKNLSGKYDVRIDSAEFNLRKGEILGIAGLIGSGRTEILEMLFGLRSTTSKQVILNNKEIRIRTPKDAIDNGFALITEERRANGIFSVLSIYENTVIASLNEFSTFGFVNDYASTKMATQMTKDLNVKTPSLSTKIRSLSGGNQQKVIISRWLLTNPSVLLMDEPTRGIDVGAKYEIYQFMIELANNGKGIIMVSSELPELIGVCDRIIVMSNGKIAGTIEKESFDQEEIMKLATKYL